MLGVTLLVCFIQHAALTASCCVWKSTIITASCTTPRQWNATPNLPNPRKPGPTSKRDRETCTTPSGRTSSPRASRGKAGAGKAWTRWRAPSRVRPGAGTRKSKTTTTITLGRGAQWWGTSKQWCGKRRSASGVASTSVPTTALTSQPTTLPPCTPTLRKSSINLSPRWFYPGKVRRPFSQFSVSGERGGSLDGFL